MTITGERLNEMLQDAELECNAACDNQDVEGQEFWGPLVEALRELQLLREQTRWVPVSEKLPPFNRRVHAWLKGWKEHSGASFTREGMAEMVRHNDAPNTVHDEWGIRFYEEALKKIDADGAYVIAWREMPEPYQVMP